MSRTDLFVPGILRGQVQPVDGVDPLRPVRGLAPRPVSGDRRDDLRVRASPSPPPARPPARCRSRSRGLAVLPTYEERGTIEQAIRGVLATEGLDVLVVDDSSPDGTGDDGRGDRGRRAPGAAAAAAGQVGAWRAPTSPASMSAIAERIRRRDRDGLRPLARPGGAPEPAGGRRAPRPRRREPLHPGRIGDGLEPLAGRPVAGRERLRAIHAGPADPRRHEWVPGVPPRRCSKSSCGGRSRPDGYGFQIELVWRATGSATTSARRRSRSATASSAISKISNSIVARGVVEGHPLGLRPAVSLEPGDLTTPMDPVRLPDLNAHNAHYVTLRNRRVRLVAGDSPLYQRRVR